MFFNRFFNICILISSVVFSKCTDGKKLTIKEKQFVFHTFYEKDSTTPPISFENEELTIDEGLSFQDIIGKLKFKSSYGNVSLNMIVGEKKFKSINEKIIDEISKSGFFLEIISDKEYNPVSLTDVFTSKHLFSTFSLAYFFTYICLNIDGNTIYISDKGKVRFIEFLIKYFKGFKNWEEFHKTFLDLITNELGEEGLTNLEDIAESNKAFVNNFLKVFENNFPKNKYNVSLDLFIYDYGKSKKGIDLSKEFSEGFILSLQEYSNKTRILNITLSSKNVQREILPFSGEYVIKSGKITSAICGDFFYLSDKYNSSGYPLVNLLKGNGYNDYNDCEYRYICEKERGGKIFISDKKFLKERDRIKLEFKVDDTNILKLNNEKIFPAGQYIYIDELEAVLKRYGSIDSFKYDEKSVKKNGTLVIKIIKPIEGKVDYVQKKIKICLWHELDDIYELKCNEKQFNCKFNINTSLKQVLDDFFKYLNDNIGLSSDTRPKNYEVLDKNGNKIEDYEKYLIAKDQTISIKLDVIDNNYIDKKKKFNKEWTVKIEDYTYKNDNVVYTCVPKDKVIKTYYDDKIVDKKKFMSMLIAELKDKFKMKDDISFKDFKIIDNDHIVKLIIENLPEYCIAEKYFKPRKSIEVKAPKNFKTTIGYSFDIDAFNIKIESKVKDVVEQIATKIKEKLNKNKIPVFDSICCGNKGSSYIKFEDGDIIQPCSCIKVMFKPDEKLNDEYIKETFDVNIDNVIIELKQLYPWYVLKEKITNARINIDLHKGDTYGEFKKKVAAKLKEIVAAKDEPILFFQNNMIKDSEKLTKTNREDLALYLDLGSSEEYYEKNTNFKEGDCNFFFYFKSDLKGFKIKEKYKAGSIMKKITEFEGTKLTLGELKKAIEKEFKINKDQYKISYENGGDALNDDSIEISGCCFYIDLVDSNLTEYLSPLIQLKCKIEYEKPNYDDYKDYTIDKSVPKEHTVEITEDSFDKINIYDFVYNNIIDFFRNKKVFDKNIYAESLNGNKISYEENNKLLKDCIKMGDVINIKLKVYQGCKLLVSKDLVASKDNTKKKYKKDINIKKGSKKEIDTKTGDKVSSSITKNVGEKEIDNKESKKEINTKKESKKGDKASSSTTKNVGKKEINIKKEDKGSSSVFKKEYPIGGSGNTQQGGAGNTQESGGCCRSCKTKKEKSDNKEEKKRRCCCGR